MNESRRELIWTAEEMVRESESRLPRAEETSEMTMEVLPAESRMSLA